MEDIAPYIAKRYSEFKYEVNIPWREVVTDKPIRWNVICAWAIDTYGLPGDKYITNFTDNHIIFSFLEQKDAIHFSLVWE